MKSKEHNFPFRSEVFRAGILLRKARENLEIITQHLDADGIEGAYLAAFDFADAAEKLTLAARQLPAYTGNPKAQKSSNQSVLENIPVKIGFTAEGWFCVTIPALLPKKQKGSVDYIREALYLNLGNFFREKPPVRYADCVLIFRHLYCRKRPEREFRDHDNIEVNAVADAIALYVLYDDSPLRCFHYYCSEPGDENRTDVFVVPQDDFITWIVDAKLHGHRSAVLQKNLPKNAEKHM